MMMRMFGMFAPIWRRKLLVEDAGGGAGGEGAGGGGSGNGGSGSGDSGDGTGGGSGGGAGGGDGAGGGGNNGAGGAGAAGGGAAGKTYTEAEFNAIKAENDRLAKEHSDYKSSYEYLNQHVEVDAQGKVKLKASAGELSEEQKQLLDMSAQRAEQMVKGGESDVKAREIVLKSFSDDPFYADNLAYAEKLMEKIGTGQKTEARWRTAMEMAIGRDRKRYDKLAEERGRKNALKELQGQSDVSMLDGENTGGEAAGADDWKSISLNKAQLRAAQSQIRSGMIKSLDDYKRNLYQMGLHEKVG